MVDAPGPRAKRSSVIIRAIVHLPGNKQIERRVRNLSATGACIDHVSDVATGDRLVMDMGSLRGLSATVVWVRDHLAGLTFAEPVDLEAARKPRGTGAVSISSGWLADLKDAYRSRRS